MLYKFSIKCLAVIAGLTFIGCEKDTQTRYARIDTLGSANDAPPVTPTPSAAANHDHSGHDHSHDNDHSHSHDHSNATPQPTTGAHATNEHSAQNSTKPNTAAIDAGNIPEPPKVKVMQGPGSNIFEVAGIAFNVNPKWQIPEKKSSAFRAAEYSIPGTEGPAEMAVFYFGPNQGGDTESNIRRWAGQFTPDAGTTATQVEIEVGRLIKDKLNIALVRTEGTYDPGSMGPQGPASTGPKPNYALFGLVVEGGPQGPVFVKVTGPRKTIQDQVEYLEAFADSARISSFK